VSGPFGRFLAEARRRKVHRVAAIYVAVGIPLLEAADLLAPVLLLPEWAYRVLGAVVLIGFPLALLASWTFDLTWAGIQRTEPLAAPEAGGRSPTSDPDAETASPSAPEADSTPPTPAPRRRQTVFAVLTAATLVMGGLGWRIATPRTVELDEQTIAILPFRVSAEPSLDYLGEGLMDLLAARLPGDVGPLALDTRTVLAQLERRGFEDARDVPLRDALEVASDLGASGVVLGSVVGTRERITADAVLFGVTTGREGARLTATAPEDSLGRMGDQLALSLLGQTAMGEPRLPAELTDSLEALRSYLRGVAFIRRGRFFTAMDELERALDIDSTFAKAGQELSRAACYTFDCGTRGARGNRIAWTFRDRLSSIDRARVEATVGPRYPAPSTRAERLAGQHQLVELRPDDWNAWYGLAWALWILGPYLGLENTAEEAMEYYRRGMSLGGFLGERALNASWVFYDVGDTAALRQVTEEFLGGENAGTSADWARWVLATATGDRAQAREVESRIPQMTPETVTRFMRFATLKGEGLEAAESAAGEVASRIALESSREGFLHMAVELQIYQENRGRPRRARAVQDTWAPGREDIALSHWLYQGWEEPNLAEAITIFMEALERTPQDDIDKAVFTFERCFAELGRVRHGEWSTAEGTLELVRAWQPPEPTNELEAYTTNSAEMCRRLLAAWFAAEHAHPDADHLIARADSFQLSGPNMNPHMFDGGLIVIAWIKERRGDLHGALNAVRRHQRTGWAHTLAAVRLREEGRLAALSGDVEGAIRAYEHLLALQSDPDPEMEAEVAGIRAEYERLVAQHGTGL
jgi:tetratricopeptide (TPR) repeat protein